MGCSNSKSLPVEEFKKSNVLFVKGGPGSEKETQIRKIINNLDYIQYEGIGKVFDEILNINNFEHQVNILETIKSTFFVTRRKKLIIDFPQQINRVMWDKVMEKIADVIGVLYFEVSEEEMKKRLLEGNKKRPEYNEEILNKRISKYEKDIEPLLPIYEKRKLLIKIDGMKSIEEISEEIERIFNERGFIAPEGPNIIFVFGGSGCGKGTQYKIIEKKFGYTSFSSPDLLRKYVEEEKEG